MIYEYEDIETGERVEISKHAKDCDPLGKVITHNGRQVKRVLSGGVPVNFPVSDKPRPRRNIDKNMPGFETYDKRGYVVATNAELKRRGFVENPHLDNPAWKD